MKSLEKQVKNRWNVSDLLKKLLRRVFLLEQNSSSGGGGVTLPIEISDVNTLQTSLNSKIPLAGTTVGNPVTGDITFNSNIVFDDSISPKTISSTSGNIIDFSTVGVSLNTPTVRVFANSAQISVDELNIEASNIYLTAFSGLIFIETGTGPGLTSVNSNADSIDNSPNSYTQKTYVDRGPINYKINLTEQKTSGIWIDSKPIFRIVKDSLNPNPVGIDTIILSRVAGSHTILEYTKL